MFTHQARWDRSLPNEHSQRCGEKIAVLCAFVPNGIIQPKAFLWNNRKFRIQRVNFSWKDKKGRDDSFLFSVQTKEGAFEISFTPNSLAWHLRKLLGP